MGGKSSSSQTSRQDVSTTNLSLEDVQSDQIIAGQNTVNITDGGAVEAMERATGAALEVNAEVSENAMDIVSNSIRSDNQMNTETLIKWGAGAAAAIALATVIISQEGKGK